MLQAILKRVLVLSWAVWLGGLVGVFLAVTTVFATLAPDRSGAGAIAAPIFGRFERLMILLAAASLVSALGLAVAERTRARAWALGGIMLACVLTLASVAVVTPRIDAMRREGKGGTPEFRRLHGVSMGLYTGTAGVLGVVGLVLPAALSTRRSEEAKGSEEDR